MNKRVFIAIGISPALREEILKWEEKFRNLPVRWLEGKNLHITLITPWRDDEAGIEKVEEILSGVAEKTSQFEICLKKVVYGPDPRKPRLIWAENMASQSLIALKNNLDEALKIKTDNRPFRLHLTLARFRQEKFPDFPVKSLNENVLWVGKVDSILLMESHLSEAGADYGILGKFSFRAQKRDNILNGNN